MQRNTFTIAGIDLGSVGSEFAPYFVGAEFGDKDSFLVETIPLVGSENDPTIALEFKLRQYLKLGFEVDFFGTLGDVDIVAPFFVNVDYQSLIREGGDLVLDTSAWSWDEGTVLASGPAYNLGLDFVAEALFVTTEERIVARNNENEITDYPVYLPDFFATGEATDYNAGEYRRELFQLDSTASPSVDFEIGLADFEARLPTGFGAVTNNNADDDDHLDDGVVVADATSVPFLTGGFSLDDLLRASNSVPLTALAAGLMGSQELGEGVSTAINTARLSPLSDEEWTLEYTVLDFSAEFGLTLVTEYTFTPGDIEVTLTNLTTGLSESGLLGDTLVMADLTTVGTNDFELTYALSGTIQASYGVGTSLAFPFNVLDVALTGNEGGNINIFSGFSDQLPNPAFENKPFFFYETPEIEFEFGEITESFSVEVLGSDDPGQDPEEPIAPEEVPTPLIMSLADAQIVEGGVLSFEFVLSEPLTSDATIYYSISGITSETDDVVTLTGQVAVNAGQLAGSILVQTRQDTDFADESLNLLVYAADGLATEAPLNATGLIIDDDIPPPPGPQDDPNPDPAPAQRPVLIGVINDTVDAGETLSFALQFDQATSEDVTISYQLLQGTAEDEDFDASGATVVLAAGETRASIAVPTALDNDADDERIELRILAMDGADFATDREAFGTIRDVFVPTPDPANIAGFADASGPEGGNVTFDVVLDRPATADVVIDFSLELLTAENFDYHPTGDLTLTIPTGQTTGQISIATNTDTDTRDEIFRLEIESATNVGSIADESAIGTIIDPDQALLPEIVATEITVTEGNSQNIGVKLAYNPQNKTVTADYALVSGSATAGSDFVVQSGSISLVSDDNFTFIPLTTIDDGLIEGTEQLSLVFSNIVGGQQDIDPFTIRITDNDSSDGQYGLRFVNQTPTVSEGGLLTFDIQGLVFTGGPNALSASATVNYSIEGIEASDIQFVTSHFMDSSGNIRTLQFNGTSGQLPIDDFYFNRPQSEHRYFVTVQLADDAEFDGDRMGFIEGQMGFSNGQNVYFDNPRSIPDFTILENDAPPPPRVFVASGAVQEGEIAEIVVQLEYTRTEQITLSYELTGADPAGNFVTTTGTVSIPAGQIGATVQIPTLDNAIVETARQFDFVITDVNTGQADITNSRASLTVIDDDMPIFTDGADAVTILGIEPDNDFFARSGDDTVIGSERADLVFGEDGDDSLLGNGGYDLLDGGIGVDTLEGGEGDDYYVSDSALDVLNENAGEGEDSVEASHDHRLRPNFETLILSGLPDDNLRGLGNSGDNNLFGDHGNNRLDGKTGNNLLDAATNPLIDGLLEGNDTLIDRDGGDTLVGGAGDDVYRISGGGLGASTIVERANEGFDILFANQSIVVPYSVEVVRLYSAADIDVVGNDGRNEINGNNGDNLVFGAGGDDTLRGAAGADTIQGGEGDDTLRGGNGDDNMSGGIGNDVMRGEIGADTLDGGGGRDRLIGGASNDQLTGGADADIFAFTGDFGFDRITDFEHGTDKLQITGYEAINGGLPLEFADLLIVQAGMRARIQLDLDRDGVADLLDLDGDGDTETPRIDLLNFAASALNAGDFLL